MSTKAESTAIVPEPKVEIYPSAPLKAVAIECHFPRMLDAMARFGAFQRKHFRTFSKAAASETPETGDDAVLLLDEKGERGVAIAPTLFSAITYTYAGGFPSFQKWAVSLLEEAREVLDVPHFTGVAYRYENVIPLPEEGGTVALDDVFSLRLPRNHDASPRTGSDFFLAWNQPWPDGSVSVDLSSAARRTDFHVHLNISARFEGPVAGQDLRAAIGAAHKMGRLTFEELITPQFRAQLRSRPS